MTYLVNDVFLTIQGEGANVGRPAIFCRLARCNLWTGREEDRSRAICKFCDTDFLHGERMTHDQLFAAITRLAPPTDMMVVFTGGEPTLQLRSDLLQALREAGYYTAIETNGTRPLPAGINWVCVSPKAGAPLHPQCTEGSELKVVFPQVGLDMDWLAGLEFGYHWLSPMDGPSLEVNRKVTVDYCLAHPRWRLNTQVHKIVGVK